MPSSARHGSVMFHTAGSSRHSPVRFRSSVMYMIPRESASAGVAIFTLFPSSSTLPRIEGSRPHRTRASSVRPAPTSPGDADDLSPVQIETDVFDAFGTRDPRRSEPWTQLRPSFWGNTRPDRALPYV